MLTGRFNVDMNSEKEQKSLLHLSFSFQKLACDSCPVCVGFQDQVDLLNVDANLFARICGQDLSSRLRDLPDT